MNAGKNTPAAQSEAGPASSFKWLLLYTVVIGLFFAEHLFLGRSILPLDVLNQMLLPGTDSQNFQIQTHYPIDEVTQLAPNAHFWRESVQSLEWPLWNPYILGGNPHQASGTWGVLSPFKIPLLLLPVERGYTLGMIFQFWFAGLVMFYYLREIRRSHAAAFLGAVAWALSSNFIMFHWLYLNVFSWLPLILLLWERGLARRSVGWCFASVTVLSIAMIGGNVQFAVFIAFAWGVYVLGRFSWSSAYERCAAILWVCCFGTVAVLLTAVQWLPFIEFLQLETQRFQNLEPGSFGLKHSLGGPLAMVATFLWPGLAGSPGGFDVLKSIGGNLIDFNGYIGIVPWVLCFFALGAWRTPLSRVLLFLASVVALLVFFTPLQRFLYHRFLLLLVFCAVVFAAAGWDYLIQAMEQKKDSDLRRFRNLAKYMTWVSSILVLGIGMFQLYVRWHREEIVSAVASRVLSGVAASQFSVFPEWLMSRVPQFIDHYRVLNPVFAVPFLCLGLVSWTLARWSLGLFSLPAVKFVMVLACVLDLSLTLRDRVPRVDLVRFPFYPPLGILEALRRDPDVFRVHRWMPRDRLLFRENVLWAYDLETISGYDSMAPDGLRSLAYTNSAGFSRWLDAANGKYLLTDQSVELLAPRFSLVAEQGSARLWHNHESLPRAWWVGDALVVPNRRAAWETMSVDGFDPGRTVVIEGVGPISSTPKTTGIPAHGTNLVIVRRKSSRRVSFDSETGSPGHLVWSATWYPGWEASLDGVPVGTYRANAVMSAVAVPAGRHRVEFQFAPGSFAVGGWISLIVLMMAGAGAVFADQKKLGHRLTKSIPFD